MALTPEQYFWHFGAGCLEGRDEHTLDEATHQSLLDHITRGTYPDEETIRAAFPKPFARIQEDGKEIALKSVAEYWANHMEGEPTPVLRGTVRNVVEADGQQFAIVVLIDGADQFVQTKHNSVYYRFESGDAVLVHGNVIAERI